MRRKAGKNMNCNRYEKYATTGQYGFLTNIYGSKFPFSAGLACKKDAIVYRVVLEEIECDSEPEKYDVIGWKWEDSQDVSILYSTKLLFELAMRAKVEDLCGVDDIDGVEQGRVVYLREVEREEIGLAKDL